MVKSKVEIYKCNGTFSLVVAKPGKDASLRNRKIIYRSLKTTKMGCCSLRCGGISSLVIGVVLILAGSLGGFLGFPALFKAEVRRQAVLVEGTDTWEAWKEPPVPVYMNFTFFDVSNPLDVANGEKPSLIEMGPFVYEQKRVKVITNPETESGTVEYKEEKSWFFDADKSFPLTESMSVTIINPVLATIGAKLNALPRKSTVDEFKLYVGKLILRQYDEGLFVTRTVRQLLFDGYDSVLLSHLKTILGDRIPSDRFDGFTKKTQSKNGTDEGLFEIDNGKKNTDDLGLIRKWKGSPTLSFWPDLDGQDSCNKINGTDGTMFGPLTIGTDKEKRLYLFVTDLCRSLYMTYNQDVEHFGIKTRRYTVPQAALASPTDNPDNACYCDSNNLADCPGSTMSLSPCQLGAPVVMSTPHFYLTNSKELLDDFDGVKPVQELHETYLDLDPIISVPVSARKRIQINIKVKKTYPLPSFENLKKDYIFPIMWVEEGAEFDQATADMIKAEVYAPITALDAVRWVLIGLGIAAVIISVFLIRKAQKKSKETV